jgi:hypothetical protein
MGPCMGFMAARTPAWGWLLWVRLRAWAVSRCDRFVQGRRWGLHPSGQSPCETAFAAAVCNAGLALCMTRVCEFVGNDLPGTSGSHEGPSLPPPLNKA